MIFSEKKVTATWCSFRFWVECLKFQFSSATGWRGKKLFFFLQNDVISRRGRFFRFFFAKMKVLKKFIFSSEVTWPLGVLTLWAKITLIYLILLIKVFNRIDKFLIDLYLWKQGSKSGSESEHFPEFRIFIVKAPISTGSSKSMVKPTGFSSVDHSECLIEFQKI